MEPGWELYRTLLAVLRDGSLSAAARSLGLTQPTIGRHIDALEAAFGVPLFTRSQQGLIATEAARGLRPYAEAMAASAEALRRAVAPPGEMRGTVRLTASEVVGAEILPPLIARLRDSHPGIAVELALNNRAEDLLRGDSDIAVRMVRPSQQALVARHIGAVPLGLFAHPRYVERHGIPTDREALLRHTLIGVDHEDDFVRDLRQRGLMPLRDAFALRSDNHLAHLALIRAGAGIGVCQVRLGDRYRLQRILPDSFTLSLELWLAMHEDLRKNLACRAVWDALAAGLAAYVGGAPDDGTEAP